MLSHRLKCVFVHIPKTAGKSVEHVFLAALGLTWETRAPLLLQYNDRPELGPPRLAHLKAMDYIRLGYMTQDQFHGYFKFAFVRDPWDRVVSFYRYLGFEQRCTFKDFLTDVFPNHVWHENYWFVCPQGDFVCNERGEIAVDFIGKFETLQVDFHEVCGRIGLPPTELPHIISVNRRADLDLTAQALRGHAARPISGAASYRHYYDDETREIVARLYARDISLFQYAFDVAKA